MTHTPTLLSANLNLCVDICLHAEGSNRVEQNADIRQVNGHMASSGLKRILVAGKHLLRHHSIFRDVRRRQVGSEIQKPQVHAQRYVPS
jgi:hypothetical protein